jgi:hypothetical protein
MIIDDDYEKARERVWEVNSFFVHLVAFIIVNIFLIILNVVITPKHFWFYWPLIGWGIGLFTHFFAVFILRISLSKKWQQDRIKKQLQNKRRKIDKAEN